VSRSQRTDGNSEPNSILPGLIQDPGPAGAIPVTITGTCTITTAGVEARTIDDPAYAGQRIVLVLSVAGGALTVTATNPVNVAGHTALDASAAGATVELVGVQIGADLRWRVAFLDSFVSS
jgi:hypothetical protein